MRIAFVYPLVQMTALLALLTATSPGLASAEGRVGIESLSAQGAWVRTPPPGARMLAGYLTLHNAGEATIRLVAARSPAFGMVEIHQSYEEDGRMRMREINPLEIPAGERVELTPGGLHLMLMRPNGGLSDGDTVVITLLDERERELEVLFSVRRDAPETSQRH